MKTIALVNTPQSPCPWTHNAACMEFIQGFRDFGYEPSDATSLEDCVGKDILLLSDHNVNFDYLHTMNQLNPTAVYLLWFYFDHIEKLPFQTYILTGEQYYSPPTLPSHLRIYNIAIQKKNYQPLLLRTNEMPDKIGTYPKNIRYDGCFIGTPYKPEWGTAVPNSVYHNIAKSGLLTSEQRREMYLSSKICFGFHHPNNIANSHVTQRVFEGLAYGCVVISDNPAARDITDGIVEYAPDFKTFQKLFDYYCNHPTEAEKKRVAGYAWAKQYGTNRYAAKLFLDKIAELWA